MSIRDAQYVMDFDNWFSEALIFDNDNETHINLFLDLHNEIYIFKILGDTWLK